MSTLRNVFKIPELRNKLLFTIFMIALYRFGSHVPVPGINLSIIKDLELRAEQGGVLGLGQSFSALARATGPVIAGWLFDRDTHLPYAASAALMLLLTVLLSGLAPRLR